VERKLIAIKSAQKMKKSFIFLEKRLAKEHYPNNQNIKMF